ncbi:MAG: DUF4982 domain-containing protein [Bacilli bacterium]|nr:DUF4982 domain-containing protein [Bacilli bacterium]
MKKLSFNDAWTVYSLTDESWVPETVTLPYDAMLREKRLDDAQGGVNTAWFSGGDYRFEKNFAKPDVPEGGKAILEFEGVYRDAEVYLNGEKLAENAYGYGNFYVDLTDHLKEENHLEVICHNADQPNSRWYTGTGIYRPVYLYLLPKKRIELNSLRLLTLDHETGKVRVKATLTEEGTLSLKFKDHEGKEAVSASFSSKGSEICGEFEIPNVHLWDENDPYLYDVEAEFDGYVETLRFGVRTLRYGTDGFFINGKRLLLRGACIHHDNGPLGAVSYYDVEYRKLSLLKSIGYNAIRSAHNPLSKYLLDVCDELGIYVMDEYVDCWYIHKTKYDYVKDLEKNWQSDLTRMVEKDYNHPCVVMYSSGNEVAETSEEKGIALTKSFTEFFHSLDDSRPVSCGINIFFNALYSMGFGVYSDKKADNNSQAKAKKQEVGSAFFNAIANFVGSNVMKVGAKLHICDRKTRGAYANMDVAGYNYGIFRYKHDLKKYPNRLILGSETFCCDARLWYEQAQNNPRLIGDFVWAGMDYLGECGVGSWVNEEDAPSFDHGKGWITAGSGRIDITGKLLGEALYTKVIYDLEPIALAVVAPKEHETKHSQSAWKYSMAMPYYDFPGQEGKKATAEVYSKAEEVALFLNGKKIGQSKVKKSGTTKFNFTYQPGELKAVSYKGGKEVASTCLVSGKQGDHLTLHPESKKPSPRDHILYVRMRLGDENGVIRPYLKSRICIEDVQGGKLIGIGNGNPYHAESYLGNEALTYQGEAIAIFHVEDEKAFSFNAKSEFGEQVFHF